MKILHRLRLVSLLAIFAWNTSPSLAMALSESEIRTLAEEAYIYGYPLVLMDANRRAPNQFYHQREFPEASSTDVAKPNVDMLDSSAWLDLSKEPVILSLPATMFRYRLVSLLSGWSDVFTSLSERTNTTAKADYAIVGPGWSGTLPESFKRIDAPTQMVWLLGQTQIHGKAEYAEVHKIQEEYKLTSLSEWGKDSGLAQNGEAPTKKAAVKAVAAMKAPVFFAKLAELMKSNPPPAADAPMLAKLDQLGIAPGRAFEVAPLGPKAGKALQQGAKSGLAKLIAEANGKIGKVENGWSTRTDLGTYGTNYLLRAAMAWSDLGAELPNDALFPMTQVDSEGKPLNGSHRYVLHFEKGEFPPGMAFWSVTLYNDRLFFAANPIGRYAIIDQDPPKANEDGSLDLYIQKESPGAEKESNWLPSPKKNFKLVMRIYYPMQKMLDGTWSPPAVKRLP